MIGQAMRRVRKSRHITIRKLAERTGYSEKHISNIERGEKTPKITLVIDLADALGVTLDEYVGRSVNNPIGG